MRPSVEKTVLLIVRVNLDEDPIVLAGNALRLLPSQVERLVAETARRFGRLLPEFHVAGIGLQRGGAIGQRLLTRRVRLGILTSGVESSGQSLQALFDQVAERFVLRPGGHESLHQCPALDGGGDGLLRLIKGDGSVLGVQGQNLRQTLLHAEIVGKPGMERLPAADRLLLARLGAIRDRVAHHPRKLPLVP